MRRKVYRGLYRRLRGRPPGFRVHLAVLCGRENRYETLRHTVSQALPVFSSIVLMDTGSTDRTCELRDWGPKIRYIRWDGWEEGPERALARLRREIPRRDWFLYLNSNELPSQCLIDYVRAAVGRIDTEGYGQAALPVVVHADGDGPDILPSELPGHPEEAARFPHGAAPRLYRNTADLKVGARYTEVPFEATRRPTAYLALYYCRHVSSDELAGTAPRFCGEPCCRYTRDMSTELTVQGASIPRILHDWQLDRTGDSVLMVSKEREQAFSLNESALAVLCEVDGRRSVVNIAASLNEALPEEPGPLQDNISSLLEELVSWGVVAVRTPWTHTPQCGERSSYLHRSIEVAVKAEVAHWRHGWEPGKMADTARARGWVFASFRHGQVRVEMNGQENGRCAKLKPYLTELAAELPDTSVNVVIDPEDEVRGHDEFPVLGFSKFCHGKERAVLIPDIDFVGGYEQLAHRVTEAATRVRWQDKLPYTIWRGTSTGGVHNEGNWDTSLRVRLCLYSRRCPDIVNARLSSCAQCTEGAARRLRENRLVSGHLPEYKQLYYKYLPNLDGNTSSWSGTYWKLLSNSLMIQISDAVGYDDSVYRNTRFVGYRQWYHHWLVEGQHYLSCDLDGLKQLLEWALEHDEECEVISENGTRFAKEYLSAGAGRTYFREILKELARLQQGEQTRSPIPGSAQAGGAERGRYETDAQVKS